jgi:DNA polymerase-3 subunit delta
MTAIKASDVDRFIARPDPAQPIVLVFGPDAGLVRERVDALVRVSVDDPNDPFALARIEADELAGNPARLVEESAHGAAVRRRRAVLVKRGYAQYCFRGGNRDRLSFERMPRHH